MVHPRAPITYVAHATFTPTKTVGSIWTIINKLSRSALLFLYLSPRGSLISCSGPHSLRVSLTRPPTVIYESIAGNFISLITPRWRQSPGRTTTTWCRVWVLKFTARQPISDYSRRWIGGATTTIGFVDRSWTFWYGTPQFILRCVPPSLD